MNHKRILIKSLICAGLLTVFLSNPNLIKSRLKGIPALNDSSTTLFRPIMIRSPQIKESPGKLEIDLFYFIPNHSNATQLCSNRLNKSLETILKHIFYLLDVNNKPIELRLTRLYYPYLESKILAQYISYNTQRKTIIRIFKNLINKSGLLITNNNKINSSDQLCTKQLTYLKGLKVQLNGRILSQRRIPRKTVLNYSIGSYARNQRLSVIRNNNQYTSKNKKGSFTIKVWLNQDNK